MNAKSCLALTLLSLTGCAGSQRILTVRSEPADAEVCIKGKPGNRHFGAGKSCIGSTPLEVDSVTVKDEEGKARVVRLGELDQERDRFYVVVSRPGYAPQALTVPSWDHFVTLRPEPAAAHDEKAKAARGVAKLSSDPVGALVYVNDFLKGNTPYVLEGESGHTLRIKVEQAGYAPIERSITLEGGRGLEINLMMERELARAEAGTDDDRAPASEDDSDDDE